jgi:hypothetical protein
LLPALSEVLAAVVWRPARCAGLQVTAQGLGAAATAQGGDLGGECDGVGGAGRPPLLQVLGVVVENTGAGGMGGLELGDRTGAGEASHGLASCAMRRSEPFRVTISDGQ